MTPSTINVARREGRDAAGTELPGSRGISALAIIVAVVGALCLGAPGPAAAIPGLERNGR